MNNVRRTRINALIEQARELESAIDEVLSEEQDYYDNMPENLQNSSRGESSMDAIDNLEEAQSSIEDCISSLENSIEV